MSEQKIRDKNDRLVAIIKTLSNGKQEIRDASGHLLGTYDPKATRDQNLKLVAKGNVLTSLIRPF